MEDSYIIETQGLCKEIKRQKINDSINDTVNQIMLDELIQESKSINPDGECENPKCSQ